MYLPHPHFGTKPCFHLVCCGGQCPDPHHWCRFSHQFRSSHQLLAQPTVQRIMFLSASSHVTLSSIPSVKLIQQPRRAHGTAWPSSGSEPHLPGYVHPHIPPRLVTCTFVPKCIMLCHGSPLQWPTQSYCMHGPNLPTLHTWQSITELAAGVKSAYMLQLTMRLSPSGLHQQGQHGLQLRQALHTCQLLRPHALVIASVSNSP